MIRVIYHLDDGWTTHAVATNVRSGPAGRLADLVVDVRTPGGLRHICREGWFSADYVARWFGLVPESTCEEGKEPGQWEELK